MINTQDLVARINEATVALFDPANKIRVAELVGRAQDAHREARESGLTGTDMERVNYAFAAFQVQYGDL